MINTATYFNDKYQHSKPLFPGATDPLSNVFGFINAIAIGSSGPDIVEGDKFVVRVFIEREDFPNKLLNTRNGNVSFVKTGEHWIYTIFNDSNQALMTGTLEDRSFMRWLFEIVIGRYTQITSGTPLELDVQDIE